MFGYCPPFKIISKFGACDHEASELVGDTAHISSLGLVE